MRALLVGLVGAALVGLVGAAWGAEPGRDGGPGAAVAVAEPDMPGGAATGTSGPDARARTGAAGHDLDEVPDSVLPWLSSPAQRRREPAAAAPPPVATVWERLASCEAGGDWDIATGNGYYGGLQFDLPTWREFGGTEFAPRPDAATREQQVLVATRVRDARGGYGSWPACARKLGLPE